MAVAITGKTHEEVMAAFTDNWTSRLGAQECLVLDNEFTSQIVRRVCQALNIEHLPTPTYNPRSNAQIERQFRTIKELLCTALEPENFARIRTLAMARSLVIAEENYETYYRRAAATYKARSPIGEPLHLDKLVWAWSPYQKLGTLGALSSKWSGP